MTRYTNNIPTTTSITEIVRNRKLRGYGPPQVSRLQFCGIFFCLYFLGTVSSSSLSLSDPKGLVEGSKTRGISDIGRTLENRNPDRILDTLGLKATLVEDGNGPEDKTFFGEDANGNPIVVGTWFQYGSYTLALAMFCTAFLVACAATAVYYVLFVVTEPSQMRRRRDSDEEGLTLTRILKTLSLAYDTYESLNRTVSS